MNADKNDSTLGEELLGAQGVTPGDAPGANDVAVSVDGVVASTRHGLAGGGDRFPVDAKLGAGKTGGSGVDSTGNDPLDLVEIGVVRRGDNNRAGVLDSRGAFAVDGVRASNAVTVSPLVGDELSGEGRVIQHREKGADEGDPFEPLHLADGSERLVIPLWLKVTACLVGVLIVAALAFVIVEPIQVLPRIGLAPGYALQDDRGEVITSEDARGALTLYTFVPAHCDERCDDINATMAELAARVPAEVELDDITFQLVTIALDSPSDEGLVAASDASGADGSRWRWASGDQATLKTVVGAGFGRFFEVDETSGEVEFDPAYVLVDGWGVVRGEYRYQTIANDADKIVSHVGILVDEIRYSGGAAGVAYEAAHLFLCYP